MGPMNFPFPLPMLMKQNTIYYHQVTVTISEYFDVVVQSIQNTESCLQQEDFDSNRVRTVLQQTHCELGWLPLPFVLSYTSYVSMTQPRTELRALSECENLMWYLAISVSYPTMWSKQFPPAIKPSAFLFLLQKNWYQIALFVTGPLLIISMITLIPALIILATCLSKFLPAWQKLQL